MRHGRGGKVNSFYTSVAGGVGETCPLTAEDARHAYSVLRLRTGDAVYCVDPEGRRFAAEIAEISAEGCAVRLMQLLPDNEAPVSITLYQGLPKADKLELIAQKLTELGAAKICPVRMSRCVVKLDTRDAEKKRERLVKIAREAAKQCKRAHAPEIAAAMDWRQALAAMARHELLIVPWEEASGLGLRRLHDEMPEVRDVGVVIGPEGGMSADEVCALTDMGARAITLGPRILRTETAAIASCAAVMALWGDLG